MANASTTTIGPANPYADFDSLHIGNSKPYHTEISGKSLKRTIFIDPDVDYLFGGGFSATGKELRIAVSLLLNDIKDKYPEEFI